jgi:hypothetical protein
VVVLSIFQPLGVVVIDVDMHMIFQVELHPHDNTTSC